MQILYFNLNLGRRKGATEALCPLGMLEPPLSLISCLWLQPALSASASASASQGEQFREELAVHGLLAAPA